MFHREADQRTPLLLPLETAVNTMYLATPDLNSVVLHVADGDTSRSARSSPTTEDGPRILPATGGEGGCVPLTNIGAGAIDSSGLTAGGVVKDEFPLAFEPVRIVDRDVDAAGSANSAAAETVASDLMMGTGVENGTDLIFARMDEREQGVCNSHGYHHHYQQQQQQEPPAKRQRELLELELGFSVNPDAIAVPAIGVPAAAAATCGVMPNALPTAPPLVGGWEAVVSSSVTAAGLGFGEVAPISTVACGGATPAVNCGGVSCTPTSATSLALPVDVGGGMPLREDEEDAEKSGGVTTVSDSGGGGGGQGRSTRGGATAGAKRSRPAVPCVVLGCDRHPTYGAFGDERGSYCPAHGKEKGLQNIVTLRCRHRFSAGDMPCPLWPAFGREADKSPTYCAKHALDGMKNINNPRCRDEACERWPSFGVPGTKTPAFCAAHKLDGMVDVVKPRCREEGGCSHRPSFGWPFDRLPTYCSAHKRLGMVDVANPRCGHQHCGRRPSFGIDGQRASRCSSHRLEGMVDVVKARCRTPDCHRIAYYKIKGTKGATRCSLHQEKGMVRKG